MTDTIKQNDRQSEAKAIEVQDEELDAASGGAIYMKVDGLKGQVPSGGDHPTESPSLNFTKIQY